MCVLSCAVHETFRNRVEQVIGSVKRHRLFKRGCYRGNLEDLEAYVTIVVHTTAFDLRKYQRFVTYGPWRHAY